MKKLHIISALTAVYESGKVIFILFSRPFATIISLPFSWYASVPMLIIPLISFILLAVNPVKYREYCLIAVITKIMFLLSTVYYLLDAFSLYLRNLINVTIEGSLQFIVFLLIFFVFDGILCIVFTIIGRKLRVLI